MSFGSIFIIWSNRISALLGVLAERGYMEMERGGERKLFTDEAWIHVLIYVPQVRDFLPLME